MVNTLCKACCEPQGITHSVAAFWTASKQDRKLPDLIACRTTILDVYTVREHGDGTQTPQHGYKPSHSLQLECSLPLHGEVQSMACLSARRPGQRDSLVLVLDAVRIRLFMLLHATCLNSGELG
jgi:hypothetical protein